MEKEKNIIFEGEYLNGKRHGKGEEFNEYNELLFEGEYLYNYRRKGKKYLDGKLIYEGEYLYDSKWSGKGYDIEGNKIYELINGNGPVKEYREDFGFPSFEGEYLNGKRNGKGKEYGPSGKVEYEGEYLNGKRNGKGKEYNDDGELKFAGEYLNGERWNGKGKEYNYDGN